MATALEVVSVSGRAAVTLGAHHFTWTEQVLAGSYVVEQRGGGEAGGAEEGIFSDDTGFFSSQETEDEVDAEEEGGRLRELHLENHVRTNYVKLVRYYCDQRLLLNTDPFRGVDFMEMCFVLSVSAELSTLGESAQLLDSALLVFARQVKVVHASVLQLAEDVQRTSRKQGKGKAQKQLEPPPPPQVEEGEDDLEDEGYDSQKSLYRLEQERLMKEQRRLEAAAKEAEEEANRSKRLSEMLNAARKRKKFIAAEDQLDNDFLKERSAGVVQRRRNMEKQCRRYVQDPYLDYVGDLEEYYEMEGILERDDKLGNSAQVFLDNMRRYTNRKRLGQLYLPHLSLPRINPGEEEGEEEQQQVIEEPVLPLGDELGGDIRSQTTSPNRMEIEEEVVGGVLENGAFGGMEEMEVDAENIQPLVDTGKKKKVAGFPGPPVLYPVVPLEELVQLEGWEGEFDMPVLEPIAKERMKKRRIPFMDQQNTEGAEEEVQRPPKVTRLEGEPEQGQNQSQQQQQQQPQENQNGAGEEAQENQAPAQEQQRGTEHSIADVPAVMEASQVTPEPDNSDDAASDVLRFDECEDDELDLTSADSDTSFCPPSLLSTQSSATLSFQTKTSRVDMSALKRKLKSIVDRAQGGHSEISFVEILQQAEMNILVGPEETLWVSESSFADSVFGGDGSPSEVSIGVAFLAMLHNASHDNFFLVEDTQGAFRVTRDKPPNPRPQGMD